MRTFEAVKKAGEWVSDHYVQAASAGALMLLSAGSQAAAVVTSTDLAGVTTDLTATVAVLVTFAIGLLIATKVPALGVGMVSRWLSRFGKG